MSKRQDFVDTTAEMVLLRKEAINAGQLTEIQKDAQAIEFRTFSKLNGKFYFNVVHNDLFT